MSAFMVDTTHIDAMLTAGIRLTGGYGPMTWMERELTDEDRAEAYQRGAAWGPTAIELYAQLRRELSTTTASQVGAMLLAENRASVNHRYNEEEIEDFYTFHALSGTPDPVVILAAISCYEYQSCEHPGWTTSEAHAFCEALRSLMIHRLPGYNEAPGEITDRRIFMAAPITVKAFNGR